MRWMRTLRGERGAHRARRVLAHAGVLVVVPSVVAVAADLVRPDGIPLIADTDYRDEILVPCPENLREARAVFVKDLPADGGGLVVVDSRPAGEFLAGHVSGAMNIPHRELHTAGAAFEAALAKDLEPLRGISGGRIIVCGDARIRSGRNFAAMLVERGFEGVRYIAGGCAAWEEAGRPWEKPEPAGGSAAAVVAVGVEDVPEDPTALAVVDARLRPRQYEQAHLPGACRVPFRKVRGESDEALAILRGVPGDKILVYGAAGDDEAEALAELLARYGWTGVRHLEGGIDAWLDAGRAIETGPQPDRCKGGMP